MCIWCQNRLLISEETAVFEDVLHAIKAARSAGFITYAIEDKASMQDRVEIKKTADFYLQDFTDPILFDNGDY